MSQTMDETRMATAHSHPAMPPCMGGWCPVRQSCRRYHAAGTGTPAERLCPAGTHDGWQPVLVTPRDIREHHALAMVQGAAQELRP